MTAQDDLPARMRRSRYQLVQKRLDAIAEAVADLREILARLVAADERDRVQ